MNLPCEFKVMRVRECLPSSAANIETPDQVAEYWKTNIATADWFDPAKEALVVLVLSTRHRIIGHNLVALGSLDSCIVTPLSVFRPIIVAAGACAILAHNHPGGDPSPSQADIKVTRDLVRAGQLLKIEILDHIVVTGETHVSLRALGYLYE